MEANRPKYACTSGEDKQVCLRVCYAVAIIFFLLLGYCLFAFMDDIWPMSKVHGQITNEIPQRDNNNNNTKSNVLMVHCKINGSYDFGEQAIAPLEVYKFSFYVLSLDNPYHVKCELRWKDEEEVDGYLTLRMLDNRMIKCNFLINCLRSATGDGVYSKNASKYKFVKSQLLIKSYFIYYALFVFFIFTGGCGCNKRLRARGEGGKKDQSLQACNDEERGIDLEAMRM